MNNTYVALFMQQYIAYLWAYGHPNLLGKLLSHLSGNTRGIENSASDVGRSLVRVTHF